MGRHGGWMFAVWLGALLLAGCNSSYFGTPDLQGRPGMVQAGDDTALWVLQKQEEIRRVGVGGGSSRRGGGGTYWREDTYYHFDVQAFDPVAARPRWSRRLVTYSDPDLKPTQRKPSRVIGSAVSGRLLGQADGRVWVLVADDPYVLEAADGTLAFDRAGLLAQRPELEGMLPSDPQLWRFDQGPVLTLADGRTVRLRGPALEIEDYVPRAAPAAAVPTWANGRERVVPTPPMRPLLRHVPRGPDRWLALFNEVEAADAVQDTFGDHALFPYSIQDAGPLARRRFHDVRLEQTTRFDDTYLRVASAEPIDGSPVLLKGRFVRDPMTGEAMSAGEGDLLVWHLDRIDSAGRLQLSRFDAQLRPRWQAPLPLSESGTANPVSFWRIGEHLVVTGDWETRKDDIATRAPHLASVALADGSVQAWNLAAAAPAGDSAAPVVPEP